MSIIIRKEKPPKFNNYKKYKKYLRKDFSYRCAYCSIHEGENGSHHNFVCEHFKPKSKMEFRHLKNTYENLLYSCQTCNRLKGKTWPSILMITNGFFFLNPCDVDFENYFYLDKTNFQLIPKSDAAKYTMEKIHLNCNQLISYRKAQFLRQKVEKELSDLCIDTKGTVYEVQIYNLCQNFYEWDEQKYIPLNDEDMK